MRYLTIYLKIEIQLWSFGFKIIIKNSIWVYFFYNNKLFYKPNLIN